MDPDSFLNLLSPELGDCYPSSSPSFSHSSVDTPGAHDDAQASMHQRPVLDSLSAPDDHNSHAHNAPYRSVLKLSDVASALQQGFPPAKRGKPINASLMQNSSRQPCSSISSLPLPAPLVLRNHGHALMPTGTFKRSLSAEANLDVENHTANDHLKMTKPSSTIFPPAASSLSALPPAPSSFASPKYSLSASASLHDPLPEKRPSKRIKTSSLIGATTTTVSKDTKAFNREGMSQREVHIYSERQRRKSMRESFSILQSLVPKLKVKHIDRITILTEVVKYIQSLHVTMEELERKRLDILSLLGISKEDAMGLGLYWWDHWDGIYNYNWANYGELDLQLNVKVRVSNPEVFITLNMPKHKGVWSQVLMLLHKYNVEVVNAILTTMGDNTFHYIYGKVDSTSSIESMDLQDKLERVILKQLRKQHKKI